jgi:hypothetical protein
MSTQLNTDAVTESRRVRGLVVDAVEAAVELVVRDVVLGHPRAAPPGGRTDR